MTNHKFISLAALAVLTMLASATASTPGFACGYSDDSVIGSNDCTGGATNSDRQAMDDIRAAMAAQRAAAQR